MLRLISWMNENLLPLGFVKPLQYGRFLVNKRAYNGVHIEAAIGEDEGGSKTFVLRP